MTASSWASVTRTTTPTASRSDWAQSRSAVGGGGARGDGRGALADDGRRVGHGPHDGGAGAGGLLQGGGGDAGGDGQDAGDAERTEGPARVGDVARLHGHEGALGRRPARRRRARRGTTAASSGRRGGSFSTTASVGRLGPAGPEQAPEEGLAHLAATDDLQSHHGADASAPPGAAACRRPAGTRGGPGARSRWSHFPDGFPPPAGRPGRARPYARDIMKSNETSPPAKVAQHDVRKPPRSRRPASRTAGRGVRRRGSGRRSRCAAPGRKHCST